MSAPKIIYITPAPEGGFVEFWAEHPSAARGDVAYIPQKGATKMQAEIDALKAELTALKGGPDYKSILFALCASLSLEDTIGDVWEDVIEALDQAGICADIGNMDEFQDVLKILPKPVMTLYGPVDEEDL